MSGSEMSTVSIDLAFSPLPVTPVAGTKRAGGDPVRPPGSAPQSARIVARLWKTGRLGFSGGRRGLRGAPARLPEHGGLPQRQVDEEGRAPRGARCHPDPAFHAQDELPAGVEAGPGAADAPREIGVEAVELREDPLMLRRRDAEALVAHGKADAVVEALDADLDGPPVGRVLDRVLDEV